MNRAGVQTLISFLSLAAVITTTAQATTPKHESPLACDRLALTAAERTRHFLELGPMLIRLRTAVHELPNGYELDFPSDTKTFALVTEWVEQERRCCPFFELDVHIKPEGGPLSLRLTGRKGVKEFIKADAAQWIQK
jgi:hypothetical protein